MIATLYKKVLPAIFVVAALGFGYVAIRRNGDAVWATLGAAAPGWVVAATAAGGAGLLASFLAWCGVARSLGAELPKGAAFGIFFVSQLGKYLPGAVWPVAAQYDIGRRLGTRPNALPSAGLITLGFGVAGACSLAAGAGNVVGVPVWWLVLIPVIVLSRPSALTDAMNSILTRLGRQSGLPTMTVRQAWRAMGWSVASAALLGLQVLMISIAMSEGRGADEDLIRAAVAGFALALVAGIIAVPAPAGVGVRDGVLVAALAESMPMPSALAAAVAARVLLTATDVLFGIIALSWLPRRSSTIR